MDENIKRLKHLDILMDNPALIVFKENMNTLRHRPDTVRVPGKATLVSPEDVQWVSIRAGAK